MIYVKYKMGILTAVYALITLGVYAGNPFIAPAWSTRIAVLALSALAWGVVWRMRARAVAYRAYMPGVTAVSLYASFASFGYRLFLSGERMACSLGRVCTLLAGAAWFVPIVLFLLLLLEGLCAHAPAPKRRTAVGCVRAFAVLFVLLSACQALVLWAFYPGGLMSDSVNQLKQAMGEIGYNDWHDVFHTLLIGFVFNATYEVSAVVGMQMLVFALLTAAVLLFFYRCGAPLPALCVAGVLFALLPNQALTVIGLVKDVPYTLSLAACTLLLLVLLHRPRVCRNVLYLLAMAADLFCIFCLRHNGVVPALCVIAFGIVFTCTHWPLVKGRLLAALLAALCAVGVFKGPVFDALEVEKNAVSPYVTMLCALGSCVNKDLPLGEETTARMRSVMSLEDWKAYYGRFIGHDLYVWGREQGYMDTSLIGAREAFSMYLEALFTYPDVVIKDRLDGMNILWDVTQPQESFNTRAVDGLVGDDFTWDYIDVGGLEEGEDCVLYNRSLLAQVYRAAAGLSGGREGSISDMLLFRSGAYLIFFGVLLLFWAKNKRMRMFAAAIPLVGNTLGLCLCLYFQSFRYVWYVQVLVLMLTAATVLLHKHEQPPDGGA